MQYKIKGSIAEMSILMRQLGARGITVLAVPILDQLELRFKAPSHYKAIISRLIA